MVEPSPTRSWSGLLDWTRSASAAAIDLIFPPVCLSCRAPVAAPDSLCGPCWAGLDFVRPPLCHRLGIPLPFDTGGEMVSAAAAADPPPFARARAVVVYGAGAAKLIHALKYFDRHDGRRLFGRWMATAGAELLADADVLVPVPLHRWRLATRQFNQSALLAKEIGRRTGVAFAPQALLRTRATVSQVRSTPEERRRNVAGVFQVPRRARATLAGRRVVLVDDVITTGATCEAATRALLRAGAAQVDVLVLAIATHRPA